MECEFEIFLGVFFKRLDLIGSLPLVAYENQKNQFKKFKKPIQKSKMRHMFATKRARAVSMVEIGSGSP